MTSRTRWISAFALVLVLLPGLYSLNSLVAQDRKAAAAATAVLQIRQQVPSAVPDPVLQPRDDFEIFVKTQVAQIRSPGVLRAVLRNPKVAASNRLGGGDGVEELRAGLKIEAAPDSELVTIGYKHSDPQFAATVVRAVVESYMTIVVDGEKRSALDRLERLRKIWEHYQKNLKAKQQSLRELQEQAAGVSSDRDSAERLRTAYSRIDQLKLIKADVSARIASAKTRKVNRDDLTDELAGVEARLELLKETVEELRRLRSARLDDSLAEDEIRLLRKTAERVGKEVERLEIELAAPSRVLVISLPEQQ